MDEQQEHLTHLTQSKKSKGEGGTAVLYVMLKDDAKKNNKRKQEAKK